jgi:uncharacterized protein YcbK (DUF882 family)
MTVSTGMRDCVNRHVLVGYASIMCNSCRRGRRHGVRRAALHSRSAVACGCQQVAQRCRGKARVSEHYLDKIALFEVPDLDLTVERARDGDCGWVEE